MGECRIGAAHHMDKDGYFSDQKQYDQYQDHIAQSRAHLTLRLTRLHAATPQCHQSMYKKTNRPLPYRRYPLRRASSTFFEKYLNEYAYICIYIKQTEITPTPCLIRKAML